MMTCTSLRYMLTQSKPSVRRNTNARKNTTGNFPKVRIADIRPWDDFTIEVLNKSYGELLDHVMFIHDLPGAPLVHHFENWNDIDKPMDVMCLLGWNDQMLRPALKFAKEYLNLYRGIEMEYKTSSPITRYRMKFERNNIIERVRADHLIALNSEPREILVFGLGLPSSNFPGLEIVQAPATVSDDFFWPLRQLAHPCLLWKTRYGYIMTEQELVACCFHKVDAETVLRTQQETRDDQETLGVSVKRIPWTQHGHQLTTDLALLWLCLLAMSPWQDRDLATEAQMVKIAAWREGADNVSRYCYSGLIKGEIPGVGVTLDPATMNLNLDINIDMGSFLFQPNSNS